MIIGIVFIAVTIINVIVMITARLTIRVKVMVAE